MTTTWVKTAIEKISADFNRSSDTHLRQFSFPSLENITLYFKDESTHVTGSLKHRLARSLFLYGLCNGKIHRDTPIIEASSGSTAVSEAYYAKLLGLRFIAVMSKKTSPEKIKRIKFYGGECEFVDDPKEDCARAKALATELNGYFMDQFTFAERATDWRGNNNIAESIFSQMSEEMHPEPHWIVCGAGTGGTSATMGRYVHYRQKKTQLCVVDPEHSVFYEFYQTGNSDLCLGGGSGVEGIGRPRVPQSFIPTIIDRMIKVPNAISYAAIHFLAQKLNKQCGGSTGTNFYGACVLANEMHRCGESGSIVTLICDDGKLYEETYYNEKWLNENGYELKPLLEKFEQFYQKGDWLF